MGKACALPGCRHTKGCRLFRLPGNADLRDRWLSSMRCYKNEFSKEARICSCHFVDGERHHGPTIFSAEKHNTRMEDFPTMKIIGNGNVDKNAFRKLPKSTTCVPLPTSIPKPNHINGNEIFDEITQVMALQKLGHLMEQETVNRFNILQEMGAVSDGLASATSQTNRTKSIEKPASHTSKGKTSEQETGQSGQDISSERLSSSASKDDSSRQLTSQMSGDKSSEQQEKTLEAKEREALLVLRADLMVPELRDLPTLCDMVTVPTTLTQATRMIFALRKDMLMLRNGVLKRALAKSEEQIEMSRKRRTGDKQDRQERLLNQLNKVFSRPQLAFLREGGKVEPWTLDDYLQAISLRLLCRHRTFEHVRNTMKIPLPSMYAVRSMAHCGLMPEVTKRYKELAEAKDLRSSFYLPAKKRAQSAGGAPGGGDTEDSRLAAGTLTKWSARGGDGARGVSKRKRSDDDEEPESLQPNSRRPCWSPSRLEIEAERNWSDGDSESGWSDHVRQVLRVTNPPLERARDRGRGQGRGRGGDRQRAGRSGPGSGGKRGPREIVEFTSGDEAGYPSEDESDQTDTGGVAFSREEPSHHNRKRDSVGLQSVNRGLGDVLRPPLTGDWESPPRLSPRKKGANKKSSQRGRVVQL